MRQDRIQLFCMLYYIPIYFEAVRGFGPTHTGVSLIPVTGALVPMSIVCGGVMRRLGRFRWAIWSGWTITIVATGLLILLDSGTRTYAWVLIFVTVGFGHGLILMSLNYCTQVIADSPDVGYAAVMYTFLRSCGICLGVTFGGVVFQNQLTAHLERMNLPVSMEADAIGMIVQLQSSPHRAAFSEAFAQTFKNVAEFMLGVAILGGLLSLMIKAASTDKALVSEHALRSPSKEEILPRTMEEGTVNKE